MARWRKADQLEQDDDDDLAHVANDINVWTQSKYKMDWKPLMDRLEAAADRLGIEFKDYRASTIADTHSLEAALYERPVAVALLN